MTRRTFWSVAVVAAGSIALSATPAGAQAAVTTCPDCLRSGAGLQWNPSLGVCLRACFESSEPRDRPGSSYSSCRSCPDDEDSGDSGACDADALCAADGSIPQAASTAAPSQVPSTGSRPPEGPTATGMSSTELPEPDLDDNDGSGDGSGAVVGGGDSVLTEAPPLPTEPWATTTVDPNYANCIDQAWCRAVQDGKFLGVPPLTPSDSDSQPLSLSASHVSPPTACRPITRLASPAVCHHNNQSFSRRDVTCTPQKQQSNHVSSATWYHLHCHCHATTQDIVAPT